MRSGEINLLKLSRLEVHEAAEGSPASLLVWTVLGAKYEFRCDVGEEGGEGGEGGESSFDVLCAYDEVRSRRGRRVVVPPISPCAKYLKLARHRR